MLRPDSRSSSASSRSSFDKRTEAMPISASSSRSDLSADNRPGLYRVASNSDNVYVMRGCAHCNNPCIDLDSSIGGKPFCSGECKLSHMLEVGQSITEDTPSA